MLTVIALHVIAPVIFALVHGASAYRVRGIVVFAVLCLVIGNVFENVGVMTGFPYGHYYFTAGMGPKLFAVPILLGLAYVGMAYLSWTLARLILCDLEQPCMGTRVVILPLLAAFIMLAWDLSQEPVWSTILRLWIWRDGGVYFGVPLSNFFGWYFCVYVIFQLFAFYLRHRSTVIRSLPSTHWYPAVVFYAASGAGNLLLLIPRSGPSVVADPTGALWRVSDITRACALVSIFVMGTLALFAWARVAGWTTPARNS
jgi:putative membrane protein